MSSDSNKILNTLPDGMLVRSDEIGFAADELSPCHKCRRPNSPDRATCIYCGSALFSDDESLPKVGDDDLLEAWENGYNAAVKLTPEAIPSVSRLLGIESGVLTAAAADGEIYFPSARTRSEQKAVALVEALVAAGVESHVVPDTVLMPEKPNVRLRSIEFMEDSCVFVDFNTGDRRIIPNKEILLIVIGDLIESRTESKWKKKPKKDDRPDDTVTDSNSPLIDIYTSRDDLGYRVQMNGFDFSGLGPAKGMIAVENMRMLPVLLKERSGSCRVDTKYRSARPLLDRVWELETETDHLGLLTASFMGKGKTKISVMNNRRQFLKYSRLQRLSI